MTSQAPFVSREAPQAGPKTQSPHGTLEKPEETWKVTLGSCGVLKLRTQQGPLPKAAKPRLRHRWGVFYFWGLLVRTPAGANARLDSQKAAP